MKSLAGLLRQNPVSHELLGPASSALAERLEAGGDYLETRGLGGVAEDAVACMRRRPVETLLFGVGLALIVSRTARSVRR